MRLVFEHQEKIQDPMGSFNSIALKVGCTAETLRKWVRQMERDQGLRDGLNRPGFTGDSIS